MCGVLNIFPTTGGGTENMEKWERGNPTSTEEDPKPQQKYWKNHIDLSNIKNGVKYREQLILKHNAHMNKVKLKRIKYT